MKLIDLANKINNKENGYTENLPEKIKIDGYIYEYDELSNVYYDEKYTDSELFDFEDIDLNNLLNKKVEIVNEKEGKIALIDDVIENLEKYKNEVIKGEEK